MNEVARPNGFEKHIQTAIQVVLVAITIWVGNSILILRDASVRLEEKNSQLRETVIELKSDVAALRLTVAQQAERRVNISQSLKELDGRIDVLEARMRR